MYLTVVNAPKVAMTRWLKCRSSGAPTDAIAYRSAAYWKLIPEGGGKECIISDIVDRIECFRTHCFRKRIGWKYAHEILYLSNLLHLYSFIHNLFSPHFNYFHFFFSSSWHVPAANGHHQVSNMLKLSHCIKCIKCSLIHNMCKSDASCLIYLMYTQYLFAFINFIRFVI
jgi:hypothetical protein